MKKFVGWCSYHQEDIDWATYEEKMSRTHTPGCWGCWYFFPYVLVDELSKKFKVTPQTIKRWIRTGKLEPLARWAFLDDGTYFEFEGPGPKPKRENIFLLVD